MNMNMNMNMNITTLSSTEFNRRVGNAKWAASKGPVFITDRGRATHGLLTIENYRRLTGNQMTLVEALAQTDVPDFEFDPPRWPW